MLPATKIAVRQAIALCLAPECEDYLGGDGSVYHAVEWENKRGAQRWTRGLSADLRLGPVRIVGQDEHRVDETTNPHNVYVEGTRTFTVSVLIESDSQEDDADAVGWLGGKLRTRLRGDAARILASAGVSVVSIMPTQNDDYARDDGRVMSASVTDILFGCVESWLIVTDPDNGDYVANVEGEYTLTHPDGTEIDGEFDAITEPIVP